MRAKVLDEIKRGEIRLGNTRFSLHIRALYAIREGVNTVKAEKFPSNALASRLRSHFRRRTKLSLPFLFSFDVVIVVVVLVSLAAIAVP